LTPHCTQDWCPYGSFSPSRSQTPDALSILKCNSVHRAPQAEWHHPIPLISKAHVALSISRPGAEARTPWTTRPPRRRLPHDWASAGCRCAPVTAASRVEWIGAGNVGRRWFAPELGNGWGVEDACQRVDNRIPTADFCSQAAGCRNALSSHTSRSLQPLEAIGHLLHRNHTRPPIAYTIA